MTRERLQTFVALLCSLSLSACALRYPPPDPNGKPEARHPSAERIAELAALTKAIEALEAPFDLRFYPKGTVAGGGTWMTCHVPPSWKAQRVLTAFEGQGASETPAWLYSPRLIENIPCGTWTAVCVVRRGDGTERTVTREFEATCSQ